MKERKWFGYGHTEKTPGKGDLAVFCAACPQPGINVMNEGTDNWIYGRGFVADGNFSCDHQKQARPEDDVWLKSGESFMTGKERYQEHLASASEHKEVRS